MTVKWKWSLPQTSPESDHELITAAPLQLGEGRLGEGGHGGRRLHVGGLVERTRGESRHFTKHMEDCFSADVTHSTHQIEHVVSFVTHRKSMPPGLLNLKTKE